MDDFSHKNSRPRQKLLLQYSQEKDFLEKIAMDDTTKLTASATARVDQDPKPSQKATGEAFVAYMNDSAESLASPDGGKTSQSTTAKALDRWFTERQKNQSAPRLLEVPNEALITNAGPLQLTGNIVLVHEDGTVHYTNHVTLCRCGASGTRPTCNGAHLEKEFLNPGKISEASEVAASQRPSKITLSCIKDGPITFRGRLRLHNQFNQECIKMRGSLCRCGQSASKPFCDGSHARTGFKTG